MNGFDVNDSTQKYQLRTLPGRFSGLHMVCLMDAAFKITDPTADIGFDLADEYATRESNEARPAKLLRACLRIQPAAIILNSGLASRTFFWSQPVGRRVPATRTTQEVRPCKL